MDVHVRFSIAVCLIAACGGPAAHTAPTAPAAPTSAPPAAPPIAPAASSAPAVDECHVPTLDEVLACATLDSPAPAADPVAEFDAARAALPNTRGARARPADPDDALSERPLTPLEADLARLARQLLCLRGNVRPWANVTPAFALARILYDANHFSEAAPLFDAVTRDAPAGDLGVGAANLALDCVNLEMRRDRGCWLPTFRAWTIDYARVLACGTPAAPREMCATLETLRCNAIRGDAETTENLGDRQRASALYESIYTNHCCGARCDEVLYNASVLANSAGDTARALSLRNELRRAYPQSALNARP